MNYNEQKFWQQVDYNDAVNVEIRKKYSLTQELSILRQANVKQEEYEEYYNYCEQCKSYVKQMKEISLLGEQWG